MLDAGKSRRRPRCSPRVHAFTSRLPRGTAAAGAFLLGTRLVPISIFSQDALAQGPWEPGVYLAILPDGVVQIFAHRSEMGTGIRTSLQFKKAETYR